MKTKHEKTYKIILSKRGKEIFKGGNIETMSKALIEFKTSRRHPDKIFSYKIAEILGSASEDLFSFEEVKSFNCI